MRVTLLFNSGERKELNNVYQVGEAYGRVYICRYRDILLPLKEGYVTVENYNLNEIADILVDWKVKSEV